MPLKAKAAIEVTAFEWVPDSVQGLVKDLRVRWALEEAGLDHCTRLIGGERPAGYEKEQPFRQVPCLREGPVQIFESGAILQYVGEQSESLLPSDPRGKFRAIQWTYAAVNSVEPFVQYRALLNGFYADQPWAEGAKGPADQLAKLRLGQVSEWLGVKQWLEGDRFTIGDLMMVTVLRLAQRASILSDWPDLQDYVRRGEARPAFQRALEAQLATYREHQPEGVAA